MSKGIFITFEGIDGCGKSTQLSMLFEKLTKNKWPVKVVREPGSTHISEKIRELLLSPETIGMVPECELLLYLASRAQLVREVIVPALDDGFIVLSDRFQEATFAYQAYGRNLGMDQVQSLNSYATGGLTPDITFIFDINVEEAQKRLSGVRDRMEREDVSFFCSVRYGYKLAALRDPGSVCILDGSKTKSEIHKIVYNIVSGTVYRKWCSGEAL